MGYSREDRLKALFKKLTADFLKTEVDARALVTVTDLTISKNGENATAFLSVFPEKTEKEVLMLLKKTEKHLSRFLATHTKMKTVPSVEFSLDMGEKNRKKIDTLPL